MDVNNYSKAIGAGVGGLLGGAASSATLGLIIPDKVDAPWYAYVIIFAIGTLAPMIGAYYAPKNTSG